MNTVTLRKITDNDLPEMKKMLTNQTIKKTYMIPDFDSEEKLLDMFRVFKKYSEDPGRFVRGIDLDGKLIGFINDVGIDENGIELGWVVSPDHQNRGCCTKAVSLALEELWKRGFRTVFAGAFAENPASMRVMEKCGMVKNGKTEEIEYRGMNHHCICYEIRSPYENTYK